MNCIINIVYVTFLYIASCTSFKMKQQESLSIVFAGDVSFAPPIRTDTGSACRYQDIFKLVSKYFKEADYNMVNLESPLVSKNIKSVVQSEHKFIHLKAWNASVVGLVSAGVKSVTLANNHLTDYGDQSVKITYQTLTKNSIEYTGLTTGRNYPYNKQKPIIKEIDGIAFGILGYCSIGECKKFRSLGFYGSAIGDRYIMRRDVLELKKKVDITIVYIHWGTQYQTLVNLSVRETAIFLADLNVNLVVGSHPHVLQSHEWINQTLIYYSLGNFLYHPHFFTGAKNRKEMEILYQDSLIQHRYARSRGPLSMTELLKVNFNKTGIASASYLPVRVLADRKTGCVYPKPKHNTWLPVCGIDDDNCLHKRIF